MVRITKIMQPKHAESLSQWTAEFRDQACSLPLMELPSFLSTFPTRWPFPRGDLYHWIPLLNRFDSILENFCKVYKLDEGPQMIEFGTLLLDACQPTSNSKPSDLEDKEVIESILSFSRVLLQNCGNRSIYASSSHLNNLLNTTSLSLLEYTLSLGSELAQRYHAAMKRTSMGPRHVHTPLLQNHYNIPLEKVVKLALPFSKTVTSPSENSLATPSSNQSAKGREKIPHCNSTPSSKGASITVFANDILSIVKGGTGTLSRPKTASNSSEQSSCSSETYWDQWGDVKLVFYPKSHSDNDVTGSNSIISTVAPSTPTPARRTSNLGPRSQRSNKPSSLETSPVNSSSSTANLYPDETPRPSFRVVEVPHQKVMSSDIHSILHDNTTGLPKELQYELLTKLRVARALTLSLETRRKIISIRLLAITNLAYIYPENVFQDLIMKQDSEEPRRLQLIYQLAELVHPPTGADVEVPRSLQSLAFSALEALQNHQNKVSDICAALNTNVNHGVLLYVTRKAVAEMEDGDTGQQITINDEWRDCLFSLLSSISMTPRTAVDLVSAGLIQILVDILNQRSNTAERYHPMVLTFLDNIMYNARDAFQTLVDADGLVAISDLIVYQVKKAADLVEIGQGMTKEFRSATVDYEIPFYQQQTIKWVFKFIHHLMSAAGGFGGNFDRLLRNLIDSSQLLASLRHIIGNARCYGSIVWTNAVSILNDFINNEPTSFAVIAEAGLSKGFLEAVIGKELPLLDDTKSEQHQTETDQAENGNSSTSLQKEKAKSDEETPHVEHLSLNKLQASPSKAPLAGGILPTSETINIVPQAFSAICLNTVGMKMFQASNVLESFFEIFESPQHVKCMDNHKELPATLGSSFDELARHHPGLKISIITAVLKMITRVEHLCSVKARENMAGAKLWTADASGNTVVANEEILKFSFNASINQHDASDTLTDVEMQDVEVNTEPKTYLDVSQSIQDAWKVNMTPYICATTIFLSSILGNNSIRSEFCNMGGIESVLNLSQSPSLEYDYWDSTFSVTMHQVIALLADSKPHLTLPSLLKRALNAADDLQPFANFYGTSAFFAPFVDHTSNCELRPPANLGLISNGTKFAKALVSIHSLVSTIPICFQSTSYNHRTSSNIFHQINVGDYCIKLVEALGPLLNSSLREVVKLRNIVPDHWKDATASDSSINNLISTFSMKSTSRPSQTGESSETHPAVTIDRSSVADTSSAYGNLATAEFGSGLVSKTEMKSAAFKNYIVLKFLLKKLPRIISPFFQTMGKILLGKRNLDYFQRQYHFAIADSLVDTVLKQLTIDESSNSADTYTYWLSMIAVLHELLLEPTHSVDRPSQMITIVVLAFKERGGFERLNQILDIFSKEICQYEKQPNNHEATLRLELATSGTLSLLNFYDHLVNGKNCTEAPQAIVLSARTDRDRRGLENFSANQFLVELRMIILPTIRRLWSSDFIEKASSQISESLISIIRTIVIADSETNAINRSDKQVAQTKTEYRPFKINKDSLTTLLDQGYSESLGSEALYRCNNNINSASEYCRELKDSEDFSRRNPIPEKDIDPPVEVRIQSGPSINQSNNPSTSKIDNHMGQKSASGAEENLVCVGDPPSNNELANFDKDLTSSVPSSGPVAINTTATSATNPSPVLNKSIQMHGQITVDDLNEERALISDNLIDRCLDAINAHGEVTFEIADLIMTVVNKSSDPTAQRKTIGETLVFALMSFAGEEDLRICGKKIAAYAHFLALLLRDKQFYSATIVELKQHLDSLIMFIKLSPKHVPEEPSPWISHILLIVEMLLSEDSKPQKTKWSPPVDENSAIEAPEIETHELSVSNETRSNLLEAILDVLPRIGKDEPLALSVLRVLVIITRSRELAQTIGEKRNIQRLFVMVKQLAGASSARIHSPLMLILRHIIEDHNTVKRIMKSEIKASLESNRAPRIVDEKAYLRILSPTVLRNPELFIEATQESVKLNRWSYPSPDSTSRHHSIVLKESEKEVPQAPPIDAVLPTVQATEDLTIQDSKPSKLYSENETQGNLKSVHEQKLPILENPDGVIHFLLCELMNYRDVEESDHSMPLPSVDEKNNTVINGDVSMVGNSMPAFPTPVSIENKSTNPTSKVVFKAEEHPIFIYRCFILQCLTELLGSYNRTKIEFINFKRNSQHQTTTPSKPRSSVINYLLFDLIPIGTLDHAETNFLRKKMTTSSWADSVLTALLAKTNEQPIDKSRDPYESEVEPDLLFVRRFVLENILKAFKDVCSSVEPLDQKYSRLLSLAELMTHIMHGKEDTNLTEQSVAAVSQKQIRRIMFEKGFIAALTASIADIDLNFPGAKRAVKYILRPLKILITTAISLNDLSLITNTPGQVDEDEIESAKSISEPEDDREETPDLFRNSTLGMFEHGGEDSESQSADDEDEDMEGTYDEYVDEMEYDDGEMDDNDEDDISDEDEIEGIGSIEGLPGDHQVEVEVIMNDHDDDHDLSADNEDVSDSDDDNEDEDHRDEIIGELEDIRNQLDDDDDLANEWESDGQDDDDDDDDDDGDMEEYDGPYEDHEEENEAIDIGAMSHLVRALGDDPATLEMIGRMTEGEQNEGEHVVAEYAEDDEEDEDENVDEDDEDIFDQYTLEDSSDNFTFGWPPEIRQVVSTRHRSRGAFSPFPSFPGGPRDLTGAPNLSYRSHRHAIPMSRSADDGTNPLLHRINQNNNVISNTPPLLGTLIPTIRGSSGNELLDFGLPNQSGITADGSATQFLEDVIRQLPLPSNFGRHGQALQFHLTTTGPNSRYLPPELEAFFGGRHTRFEERRNAPDPVNATHFTPKTTVTRWSEESRILFGNSWVDKAADLSGAIMFLLVPPAIEADKAQKDAQFKKVRQEMQDAKRKADEKRIEEETKVAEEFLARERKEEEELVAVERSNEGQSVEVPLAENSNNFTEEQETAVAHETMEGVETDIQGNTDVPQTTSTEGQTRITTVLRGTTFDITDFGIDADFLAELPEEIREEVIMSAVAERRSQAAATGVQPSEIDQEFLNALPDDIRDEIIQQERRDRRRREREERNRQTTVTNGGATVGDMDAATILATLDPSFRNQVLMEQDDATLALLPPEMADQARAAMRDLTGNVRLPSSNVLRHSTTRFTPHTQESPDSNTQRSARRPIMQILDKPGVATLLRLMFIFQHGSLRSTLNSVLQNVCMNKLNRQEVLSTILHILQDGSSDMMAVERSFAYLSLRAKQPKEILPKAPQPPKRPLTGLSSLPQSNFEAYPLMVVSQCLTTLIYLIKVNQHIAAFFLLEHEVLGGLKRTLSRKGKGKENKSSKYAINTLLTLLDRNLIMESSSVMESLSTLLNLITLPLQVLQRKQKEITKANNEALPAVSDTLGLNISLENSTIPNEPHPEAQTGLSSNDIALPDQNPPTHVITVTPTEFETEVPADTLNSKLTSEKVSEKKQRSISPPIIPEYNLKLVINIFVARECSSKTFRETLSTIKNLSAIPDAKTVFGRELVNKAQSLSEIILVDLEELLPQIQKATTGTEIQGIALAKFSPGGSDQNKLLRVLTALDHLFDPKREKKDKPEGFESKVDSSESIIKKDLLSSPYENSTFGRMWQMLSACLNAIRQREHMLNVATILLPLIESLMVVCKNTANNVLSSNNIHGKELVSASPPADSRMESLFFNFTEEHRKILNDLVRHTPKLMSGTFSLLVKNPKVLEFDNKRNYFNRSIHAKASNSRETYPTLQLSVRRDLVFHDSFKSLYFQSGDQMKYGKLSIRFHGEEGIDAGGVTREWFQVLSRQMFDPGYALFIPVSSDRTTFHPNQLSSVNEEHLMFFKFIGRIIGKALYEGRVLDCHFSRAVYKRILRKSVSVKDMESLDPDYYKSLIWMLENDITDIITETFSVDSDKFGVNETIDFIPNGFHDIVPPDLISIFNEQELELLISGLPEINVDDWKGNTEYHNYTTSSPQVQWFWRAVRSFDKEEKAKLLQFVTGTSKVPLNGFKELEGMNGFSRFNIHRDYGNKNRLPSSHTCFNQLDLPEYDSYEILRQQLLTAITAGSDYFGFA
ncbi:putative e3 ubiquitin-protein ligase [Golovinomyces cichoracearum]|uniref:HECT-type E3 ubiquitin transferase n=1 Tax=Golovinomyces cichoracearum TaxID=62708 RepID=A0A420HJ36_9PEZI|nr:putative e3 ubiquitin-protein ligase [Golovinomyces cichoracearum]